jgi:hypothetical protein
MLPRKFAICWLILSLCLFPAFCIGEAGPEGVWDGTRYVNSQSDIEFMLPENWLMDPEGLLPNPFFDVLASDQAGANAIAIGLIDLSELVKLIPLDALGPYAGLLDHIDWTQIDGTTIMNMMASAFASGVLGEDSGVQAMSVDVGENEYMMISIDLYDGALLESMLIRPVGRQMSVILLSSSDQTEAEWFLSHFL